MEIIPKSLGSLYLVLKESKQVVLEGTVYPSDKPEYKQKVVWDTGEVSYHNLSINALGLPEAASEKETERPMLNGDYVLTQDTEYCSYKEAIKNFTSGTKKNLEYLGWKKEDYVPSLKRGEIVTVLARCDGGEKHKPIVYAVATANLAERRKWTIVLEKELAPITPI